MLRHIFLKMKKNTFFISFFLFSLSAGLAAADMDMDGDAPKSSGRSSSGRSASSGGYFPTLLDAGDVPTAYPLGKYEMRVDTRFYSGGGIMSKAYLGIFPRFFLGGGLNVRGLIGSGNLSVQREDAQFLCRVLLMKEDRHFPALSAGWDGPAYEGGVLRGLYVTLSKELDLPIGFYQIHGGVNNPEFDHFLLDRDLRGFVALTTLIYQVALFGEMDEILDDNGPVINAGLRVNFDPISLGVEFRDLSASRSGGAVARMLRVNFSGSF